MAEQQEKDKTQAGADVCAEWAVAKPARHDFAAVVSELNAWRLVGEGSIFERGAHVPITNMGYFKQPNNYFLSDLRARDRRSAKEWEYINGVGVWIETALLAMELARTHDGDIKDVARIFALAEESIKAEMEVASMRAQFFLDVTENGVEEARQIAYIVEQGHDAVHSGSYRAAREALTGKIAAEAAKQLAKNPFAAGVGREQGSQWWNPGRVTTHMSVSDAKEVVGGRPTWRETSLKAKKWG